MTFCAKNSGLSTEPYGKKIKAISYEFNFRISFPKEIAPKISSPWF